MRRPPLTRRWLSRSVVFLLVIALLTPSAVSALTYDPDHANLQAGTIQQAANGSTVVAVQGFHFQGRGATKKPARLAQFGPRGNLDWVHEGGRVDARWFYDVDPLPDGNLLVTATNPDGTVVYALDPATQEREWIERLNIHDTHDVDQINGDELLVANMRNYDNKTGENNDRIFVYNRTTDEIVWEWYFKDHYPRAGGGKWTDDWTHVNDVDKIGDGRYMVSVRNFDQVIVINRETGDIDLQLGQDGRHAILHEQHNPQYLESANGTPAILVADSENARIVEYEKRPDGWERTWTLGSSDVFSWPRDADRLPNGNTLIVDSLNHRVIEVTPTGKIVWEVYVPWGTYDAERTAVGDEAYGYDRPTITDLDATGSYTVTGSAGLVPGTGDSLTFPQQLMQTFAGTPLAAPIQSFATRWAHVAPWVSPVWMSSWDFARTVLALVLSVGWIAVEVVLGRRQIIAWFRRHLIRPLRS